MTLPLYSCLKEHTYLVTLRKIAEKIIQQYPSQGKQIHLYPDGSSDKSFKNGVFIQWPNDESTRKSINLGYIFLNYMAVIKAILTDLQEENRAEIKADVVMFVYSQVAILGSFLKKPEHYKQCNLLVGLEDRREKQ